MSVKRSKIKGKSFFIDFSSPSTQSMGCTKHCLLTYQVCTNGAFFQKNSQNWIAWWRYFYNIWKENKISMPSISIVMMLDNASEILHKWEMTGTAFKYNIPGAPQQNSKIEHKFAIFYERVQTILNCGKFSSFEKWIMDQSNKYCHSTKNWFYHKQQKIWAHFSNLLEEKAKHCNFDSIILWKCIITHHDDWHRAMLSHQYMAWIVVGYAHLVDKCRIVNPKTWKISFKRVMIFE